MQSNEGWDSEGGFIIAQDWTKHGFLVMQRYLYHFIFIYSHIFLLFFQAYLQRGIFDPKRSLWRGKRRCLVNQIKELFIRALVEVSKLSQASITAPDGMCFWNTAQQRWIIDDICFCIVMLWMRVCLCVSSPDLTKQASLRTGAYFLFAL